MAILAVANVSMPSPYLAQVATQDVNVGPAVINPDVVNVVFVLPTNTETDLRLHNVAIPLAFAINYDATLTSIKAVEIAYSISNKEAPASPLETQQVRCDLDEQFSKELKRSVGDDSTRDDDKSADDKALRVARFLTTVVKLNPFVIQFNVSFLFPPEEDMSVGMLSLCFDEKNGKDETQNYTVSAQAAKTHYKFVTEGGGTVPFVILANSHRLEKRDVSVPSFCWSCFMGDSDSAARGRCQIPRALLSLTLGVMVCLCEPGGSFGLGDGDADWDRRDECI
ncbi:hypothetical protein SCUCBS95973_007318 [Sporothrix curviconia]|uniref:Uncharacterized protein n=1 Tax=Sporothrix curviconia TaxID=1260050 RepID=A0ABP0CCF3_9PEZI